MAGGNFRFGQGRLGDLETLRELGSTRALSRSSRACPRAGSADLVRGGEIERAARLLGRPPELDGLVVAGDARGDTLGFPTANLQVDPRLLVPAYGIYAGAALDDRAAISIGTNPHYEGTERRVEAHLLDFEGDLYGERLVVELWRRLRDEAQFESQEELVAQIARDVEETRAVEPPVRERPGCAASTRIAGATGSRDRADAAE